VRSKYSHFTLTASIATSLLSCNRAATELQQSVAKRVKQLYLRQPYFAATATLYSLKARKAAVLAATEVQQRCMRLSELRLVVKRRVGLGYCGVCCLKLLVYAALSY
jgi:hypothetical protein